MLIASLCLLGASVSFAHQNSAEATRADAEEWIQTQLQFQPADRLPSGVKIAFNTTRYTTKTESELEVLKAELASRPDHSRQRDIQAWAVLAKHPHVSTYSIWIQNERLWRLCWDRDDGKGLVYSDRGRNAEGTWSLTAEHLATLDNSAMAFPQVRNPPLFLESLTTSSIQYFFGGIGHLPNGSPRLEKLSEEGGQWTALIFSTTGRHRIRFRWYTDCGTFFPTKVELLSNADSSVLTTWNYDRPSPAIRHLPLCRTVSFECPGVGHRETYRLDKFEEASEKETLNLAMTPTREIADPIRGEATFRSISYANGSNSFVKTRTPNGDVVTRVPTPVETGSKDTTSRWLLSGALGVAAVVCVSVWKRRSG